MIGIICETPEEVQSLQEDMEDPLIQKRAGMKFVTGTVDGKQITVVCSNGGKVNNAVCTEILLGELKAEMLLGFGTARGLTEDLRVGDVVLVRSAAYFDVDASALGYQPGEVIGVAETEFAADERLLAICRQACEKVMPPDSFREGMDVTGDRIVTVPEEQQQLHILWEGDCADMEGAAIAQVAYLHEVPWLLVRAVAETPETLAAAENAELLEDEDEDPLPVYFDAVDEDPLDLTAGEDGDLFDDIYSEEASDASDYLYFRETCIEDFTRILREMLPQL